MSWIKKAENREREVAHDELKRMVEQVRQRNAEHARWIPCFHALSRWLPLLKQAVDEVVCQSTLRISYKCHIRADLSGNFPFGGRISGWRSYDEKIAMERSGFESIHGWDRGYPIAVLTYRAPQQGGQVQVTVGDTFGFFGTSEPRIWLEFYNGRPNKKLIRSYRPKELSQGLIDWWLKTLVLRR